MSVIQGTEVSSLFEPSRSLAPPRQHLVVFCVYAIRSEKTGRIYIGQTVNLEARFRSHNRGYVASTATERPWTLIKQQSFSNRSEARWIEFCLKRSRGRRLRWLGILARNLQLRAGGGKEALRRTFSEQADRL